MKLKFFFMITFLLIGIYFVTAHDLIILRDGSFIEARVIEISQTEIRFRHFDNLEGPVRVISIINVLSIRYENGTSETFTDTIAEQVTILIERKSANVRNNWLSVGATAAGAGLKYERMLHSHWSLGFDTFYQTFGFGSYFHFGLNIAGRVYPVANVLYIGTGLGFYGYEYRYGYLNNRYEYTVGFAIFPELGCKIDVGRPGGFFMDIGLKFPIIFGGRAGFHFSLVPYLGFGGAF